MSYNAFKKRRVVRKKFSKRKRSSSSQALIRHKPRIHGPKAKLFGGSGVPEKMSVVHPYYLRFSTSATQDGTMSKVTFALDDVYNVYREAESSGSMTVRGDVGIAADDPIKHSPLLCDQMEALYHYYYVWKVCCHIEVCSEDGNKEHGAIIQAREADSLATITEENMFSMQAKETDPKNIVQLFWNNYLHESKNQRKVFKRTFYPKAIRGNTRKGLAENQWTYSGASPSSAALQPVKLQLSHGTELPLLAATTLVWKISFMYHVVWSDPKAVAPSTGNLAN